METFLSSFYGTNLDPEIVLPVIVLLEIANFRCTENRMNCKERAVVNSSKFNLELYALFYIYVKNCHL